MPKTQENSSEHRKGNHVSVEVKGIVDAKYFLVSEDTLNGIQEFSDTSSKSAWSLFFLSIASTLLTVLLTTNISNKSILLFIVAAMSITFTIGAYQYLAHIRNKKKLAAIVRKIKRSKCSTEKF